MFHNLIIFVQFDTFEIKNRPGNICRACFKADSNSVNLSRCVGGVQKLMGLVAVGLTQILGIERLDFRVLMALAQRHIGVFAVKRLCTISTQIGKVVDIRCV